MKRFMVVYWYYGKGSVFIRSGVKFYDSLAQARIFVDVTNSTGDRAQLYRWQSDGPEGYYVYCNE